MSAQEIANKLWSLCNVLRDDGVTYHQYLNELTYILFLKLSDVKGFKDQIPEKYQWQLFVEETDNLKNFNRYREFLATISSRDDASESIKEIYTNAATTLTKPVNFNTLVKAIDKLDWYDEHDRDVMGDIYETLLEKNAGEKKSGAGQYFTPRALINIMVDLMAPKLGEKWNDPACGTFGFMIAADHYLRTKYDYPYTLEGKARIFQLEEAMSGVELVGDAHRLALMNARLHGMESRIYLGDTLTDLGKKLKGYDGVLANPPFGTKKGGEKPRRDDLSFVSSNKQLNFLQHIYRSLKKDGNARAAVILPDNVLFEDGDGQRIRKDLLEKCNLHTILRLPTGIFYAAGVKTNVLFFTRGKKEDGNTQNVWYYDMRTDVPSYGIRTPFTAAAFSEFVLAYTGGIGADELLRKFDGKIEPEKRAQIKDERWRCISIDQIKSYNYNLDLGLITESSLNKEKNFMDPLKVAKEAMEELLEIQKELKTLIEELS